MARNDVQVAVRMPIDLWQAVKKHAEKQGVPVSIAVRQALRKTYLKEKGSNDD